MRAAYRALAKAWHPDVNRANESAAQEMMVRLNLAYDRAMKVVRERAQGEQETILPDAFAVAQQLFVRGLVRDALRMLNRAPLRDGPWYALQGAILLRLGEPGAAHASYRAAVRLEPGNEAYRAGALQAAVRMRRKPTVADKITRWVRRAVYPLRVARIK